MTNKMIKPVSLAVGAAFLGSLTFAAHAANGTGMQATDLAQGYMLVGDEAPADKSEEEGKCGEGKCGEGKKDGGKV